MSNPTTPSPEQIEAWVSDQGDNETDYIDSGWAMEAITALLSGEWSLEETQAAVVSHAGYKAAQSHDPDLADDEL